MSETEAWTELEEREEGNQEISTVTRLNCGKINFHTGSAVFPFRGIDVIKGVLLHLHQLGDEKVKVLIAAHTDTQDTHANNQKLSALRARSTLYMLEFDREAWGKLCHEESQGSKAKDIRDVLKWASKAREWDCNTGNQAKDVQAFKTAFLAQFANTNLTDTTPTVDAKFWERVFNLYQVDLYGFLREVKQQPRKEFLKNLEWLDPQHKAIGCSERDPIKPTADNVNEPENRRVEFLFFKPGQEPRKDDELPPDTRQPQDDSLPPQYLEAVYDPRRYTFFDLDCPRPFWMGRELPEGNILFVVDRSGSMQEKQKWVRLKRALVGAINALSDTDHFGILAYGSGCVALWGVPEAAQLKPANEANRDEAIDWINGMAPAGATYTYLALAAAFKSTGLRTVSIERREFNTIEFLSDGAPTVRHRICEACGKDFEITGGPKCPHCQVINKGPFRPKQGWNERKTIIEEVKANNTGGWTLNATAFVAKPPPNARNYRDPLAEFMEALTKQTNPPGAFKAFEF